MWKNQKKYTDLVIFQSGLFVSLSYLMALTMSVSTSIIADFVLKKKIMSLTSIRKLCNTFGENFFTLQYFYQKYLHSLNGSIFNRKLDSSTIYGFGHICSS